MKTKPHMASRTRGWRNQPMKPGRSGVVVGSARVDSVMAGSRLRYVVDGMVRERNASRAGGTPAREGEEEVLRSRVVDPLQGDLQRVQLGVDVDPV